MDKIKFFLIKYDNISSPVKASVWFTVCNFLQKGINMLTLPIFTRILTTEEYGIFTIYQSWYNILTIFATLNLSAGVFNNGMIKYENEKEKYTSALNGLSITVTSLLFFVYLLGHSFFNRLLGLPTLLVVAMFIELLFVPAYSLWSVRQRFDYKYKPLVVVTFLLTIISPIVGVVAVLLSTHKAEARVLSYVGIQICVGIILTFVNFYKGKRFYVKSFWKYALWFNIPLIPHYLSMTVLGQADRIMISRMIGMSEAAIYGLAYNISQMMVLITSAVNGSLIPYTYKSMKEKKYSDIGSIVDILMIMWACFLIVIVCFGPEIIRLFASKDYYEARWIVPPVALSVYFTVLYNLFGNIEFYFEANKFIMCASVIGAASNIILNYIFIPKYGYIAAGYTTLFCYILFSLVHYLFHIVILNKKASGVRIYNIKLILTLSFILILFVFCITLFYDNWCARYMIIALTVIVVILNKKYFFNMLKTLKFKKIKE